MDAAYFTPKKKDAGLTGLGLFADVLFADAIHEAAALPDIRSGFCECGCGGRTRILTKTRLSRGDVKGHPARFINSHALRRFQSGSDNPAWRGGRTVDGNGYVQVKDRSNNRAGSKGYVTEHIAMVERAMGHALPVGAEVHHVDSVRTNNAPSNLVACHDKAYHHLLHKRQRALDACGDPSAHRCVYCGGYGRQAEMVRSRRGANGPAMAHKSCKTAYQRKWYRQQRDAGRPASEL